MVNKLGGMEGVERFLRGEFEVNVLGSSDYWKQEWSELFQDLFGLTTDFSGVEIPKELSGFGWVVMVPQGLTLNQVWAKCQELFPCYSCYGDDLDKVVTGNERTLGASYARRFRDRVEADKELKNLSANQLAGTPCITLLERLLLELWYFWKYQKHLDIKNVTLCAGSWRGGGYVPSVYWYGDGLKVGYDDPDGQSGNFRARACLPDRQAAV